MLLWWGYDGGVVGDRDATIRALRNAAHSAAEAGLDRSEIEDAVASGVAEFERHQRLFAPIDWFAVPTIGDMVV